MGTEPPAEHVARLRRQHPSWQIIPVPGGWEAVHRNPLIVVEAPTLDALELELTARDGQQDRDRPPQNRSPADPDMSEPDGDQ